MKRTLSLALASMMLVGTMSCGGETPASEETTGGETTLAETTADPLALTVEPDDFGGYTITYLTCDLYTEHFRLDVESENGDTLNDAGYKREQAVSELLNVEFASHEVASIDDLAPLLTASVMANTHEYDFAIPHANKGFQGLATEGVLLDWNELPNVDFTKPWWNATMQKDLGINGKLYYAPGDITMLWQGMCAYLFNKDYLEDYNIEENLYDLVWEGKWTVDKMMSLAKGMYRDLNGNSERDKDDQYGILANLGGTAWFQFGCDQRITTRDENDCPVLDMGTERMITVTEKYYALLNSEDTHTETVYSSHYAESPYRDMLFSGRSFISAYDVGGAYSYLREIDFEFGILPSPKLDEEQDGYKVFCGAGMLAVPADADNLERTGKVAEALAYYSYQYVRPAYFDVVLQNKALRDEDSFKILTMMHESKVFDFGFNYNTVATNALDYVVVTNKSTDFASYYASFEDRINDEYRTVFESVEEKG